MNTGKIVVLWLMLMTGSVFLVSCGGKDSPSAPATASFTGTFTLHEVEEVVAAIWNNTYTLTLMENGNILSGNYQMINSSSRCTINFTVPVTGTVVTATTGIITIPPENPRCIGEGIDLVADYHGGTFDLSLSDDGNTLNVGTDHFTRQ